MVVENVIEMRGKERGEGSERERRPSLGANF